MEGSTSSRLPYEYDAVMGITQVDPKETEGFDEGLDLEYHDDATEDPNVLEPADEKREPGLSHGGCGSSSLRECIELLTNTERNAPATLHSGANKDSKSGPPQKRLHIAENHQKHTRICSQKPLGLGIYMGDMAARRYENA